MKYLLFYEDRKIKWKLKEKFMNATMSLENVKHYPVMLNQVLSIISPQHGGTFIDCTFGGGGFSRAILKFSGTKVIAIDRDQLTQNYANSLKKEYPKRFNFFKEKFSNLNKVINKNLKPRAVIFDLGLSSFQLSDSERGFSFESKNSLNMEMGINKRSAYEVVNFLDKEHLATIIKVFGDEKEGRIIANKIDKYRKKKPIETSQELASIINQAKRKYNYSKKNPATKTFQAIRIFVNQELTELIFGLVEATRLLSDGGILIVVSFHSLEDKIVKNFFSLCSNIERNPSRYLPITKNKSKLFQFISKKPLVASIKEIKENIRSRSAKLRYGIRNNSNFTSPNEFQNKFENYFRLESNKI